MCSPRRLTFYCLLVLALLLGACASRTRSPLMPGGGDSIIGVWKIPSKTANGSLLLFFPDDRWIFAFVNEQGGLVSRMDGNWRAEYSIADGSGYLMSVPDHTGQQVVLGTAELIGPQPDFKDQLIYTEAGRTVHYLRANITLDEAVRRFRLLPKR